MIERINAAVAKYGVIKCLAAAALAGAVVGAILF